MTNGINTLQSLSEHLTPSQRMPVLFVGHGNPMYAIEENEFAKEWDRVGKTLPKPQAIVVISAHWLSRGTHIQSAPHPDTIHDFAGFPPELFAVQYNVPGSPLAAQELQRALEHYEAQLDASRGFDHGMWAVMMHLAPNKDIPMLQISLDINQSLPQLMAMFETLRPLREKGVLFIGSGNIVHNLYQINWQENKPFDWALEFDEKITGVINTHDAAGLARPETLGGAALAQLAIPTDDHYRPMLAAMALTYPAEQLTHFNTAIDMGSVGMRSFITQ